MAAAAAAALLHRGGLGVDASRAAAPVVSGQGGSPAVRDVQRLEEQQPAESGAAHTLHPHRQHRLFLLISLFTIIASIVAASESTETNLRSSFLPFTFRSALAGILL